jgi:hypothetical protein
VHRLQPFIELSKMIAAALIGALVTAIHHPVGRDRPKSLEQAQTLLCVSGAVMMIIIGNSLARAFGIAGAAGIVRFRTPVDDPKDVTILFLLMGLGMATGLGAFAVAGSAPRFSASRCCPGPLATQKRGSCRRDPRAGRRVPDRARRKVSWCATSRVRAARNLPGQEQTSTMKYLRLARSTRLARRPQLAAHGRRAAAWTACPGIRSKREKG